MVTRPPRRRPDRRALLLKCSTSQAPDLPSGLPGPSSRLIARAPHARFNSQAMPPDIPERAFGLSIESGRRKTRRHCNTDDTAQSFGGRAGVTAAPEAQRRVGSDEGGRTADGDGLLVLGRLREGEAGRGHSLHVDRRLRAAPGRRRRAGRRRRGHRCLHSTAAPQGDGAWRTPAATEKSTRLARKLRTDGTSLSSARLLIYSKDAVQQSVHGSVIYTSATS